MAKAVKIPVTVKMRAGWNDGDRNAPTLARMVQDAGAAADRRARPDRGAELQRRSPTGIWSRAIADELTIPVFGSGDCIEPEQIVANAAVGSRGRARRPRRAAQSVDSGAGRRSRRRTAPRTVTLEDRGQFLLDYIDLLLNERIGRARAPIPRSLGHQQAARAGLLVHEGPRERIAPPHRDQQRRSLQQVRDTISTFFCSQEASPAA